METVPKESFASWPDSLHATQMHQLTQIVQCVIRTLKYGGEVVATVYLKEMF